MKKRRPNKDESLEKKAQKYWNDNFYKKIKSWMQDDLKSSPVDAKEKHTLKETTRLLKSVPVDSIEYALIQHEFLVKPHLLWGKVKNSLKELNVDDGTIRLITFHLKPIPIERTLVPLKNPIVKRINKEYMAIFDRNNQKIKHLSPLVRQLEKLQQNREYKGFHPLALTIKRLKDEIALCREIVKFRKKAEKEHLNRIKISYNLNKSTQKHEYWNLAVQDTLSLLNPFYCTDDCNRNTDGNFDCDKTHEKAIRKVAELLKILYPSIWEEDIKTIANRIKQKNRK